MLLLRRGKRRRVDRFTVIVLEALPEVGDPHVERLLARRPDAGDGAHVAIVDVTGRIETEGRHNRKDVAGDFHGQLCMGNEVPIQVGAKLRGFAVALDRVDPHFPKLPFAVQLPDCLTRLVEFLTKGTLAPRAVVKLGGTIPCGLGLPQRTLGAPRAGLISRSLGCSDAAMP